MIKIMSNKGLLSPVKPALSYGRIVAEPRDSIKCPGTANPLFVIQWVL